MPFFLVSAKLLSFMFNYVYFQVNGFIDELVRDDPKISSYSQVSLFTYEI